VLPPVVRIGPVEITTGRLDQFQATTTSPCSLGTVPWCARTCYPQPGGVLPTPDFEDEATSDKFRPTLPRAKVLYAWSKHCRRLLCIFVATAYHTGRADEGATCGTRR